MPYARTGRGTRAAPRLVRYIWPLESTCRCGCPDWESAGRQRDTPRRYRRCLACGVKYVVRATHCELDDGGPNGRIAPLDK